MQQFGNTLFQFDKADFDIQTPVPEIPLTDIDAFKARLNADDSPVQESVRHWFVKAATEQLGWKNGHFAEYLGLEWLIDCYGDSVPGTCAWIGPRGEILSCAWANHDSVCEAFLGKVQVIEGQWARMTHQSHAFEDAIRYVDRMTDKMVVACHQFGGRYPNIYTWARPDQFK
jgi:hypothetical protein